jgi:hypothetical protein
MVHPLYVIGGGGGYRGKKGGLGLSFFCIIGMYVYNNRACLLCQRAWRFAGLLDLVYRAGRDAGGGLYRFLTSERNGEMINPKEGVTPSSDRHISRLWCTISTRVGCRVLEKSDSAGPKMADSGWIKSDSFDRQLTWRRHIHTETSFVINHVSPLQYTPKVTVQSSFVELLLTCAGAPGRVPYS